MPPNIGCASMPARCSGSWTAIVRFARRARLQPVRSTERPLGRHTQASAAALHTGGRHKRYPGSFLGPGRKRVSGCQPVVLAPQFKGGLKEAFLAAAVVAYAFVLQAEDLAVLHEACDAVGELNLAAHAGLRLAQVLEDLGFENVSSHHRKVGRRFCRGRL